MILTTFEQQVQETATQAATEAGKILIQSLSNSSSRQISAKSQFDFVTEVDLASEKMIIEQIKQTFPNHNIFAEEKGRERQTSEFLWIIDPLDGTKNYIHGFPFFSISIALKHKEEIIFGLIADPLRQENFHAIKNKGAFLNDQPIHTSSQQNFQKALFATGFPFRDKSKITIYLQSFAEIFGKAASVRRAGSAALDLAYTACGRVDGFWEIGLNAWDIAAGVIILQEAGGIITDFRGENNYLDSGNVVAANSSLHPELLEICHRILKDCYFNQLN